jgi:hypothetical protein
LRCRDQPRNPSITNRESGFRVFLCLFSSHLFFFQPKTPPVSLSLALFASDKLKWTLSHTLPPTPSSTPTFFLLPPLSQDFALCKTLNLI